MIRALSRLIAALVIWSVLVAALDTPDAAECDDLRKQFNSSTILTDDELSRLGRCEIKVETYAVPAGREEPSFEQRIDRFFRGESDIVR
ncbi:hypothetical protein BMJ29_25040 [Sinorhizobium medicae]|nr:hypothetical protein BMJ30_26315 [Sinorhizobium medicae]PLU15901.1 hypothetical protein BMJ29_25040 [Sinorhizobium medicae]